MEATMFLLPATRWLSRLNLLELRTRESVFISVQCKHLINNFVFVVINSAWQGNA